MLDFPHDQIGEEEGNPAGGNPACSEIGAIGDGGEEFFGDFIFGSGGRHETRPFGLADMVGENHADHPSNKTSGESGKGGGEFP